MATALLSIESQYLPERQRLVLALGQVLNIGSSRMAHFQIPDPDLKPIHLRLTLARGGVFLETHADEDQFVMGSQQYARARIPDNGQIQFQSVKIIVATFGLETPPTPTTSELPVDGSTPAKLTDPVEPESANDLVSLDTEMMVEIGLTDAIELEEQSTESSDDETPATSATRNIIQPEADDDPDSVTIVSLSWKKLSTGFFEYRVAANILPLFSWLIPFTHCRLITPQTIDSEFLRPIRQLPNMNLYQANSISLVLSDLVETNYVILSTSLSDDRLALHLSNHKSAFQSASSFLLASRHGHPRTVKHRMGQISLGIAPTDDGDFAIITAMFPEEFVAAAAEHQLAIVESLAE